MYSRVLQERLCDMYSNYGAILACIYMTTLVSLGGNSCNLMAMEKKLV